MTNKVSVIGTLFMAIPKQYNDVYEKILLLFSEYGLEAIKDCKVSCKDKNSKIIDCFNMFSSGVAAWNAKRYKEANLILNYVRGQLDIYYPNKPDNSKYIYFVNLPTRQKYTDITKEMLDESGIKVNNIKVDYIVEPTNDNLYIITDEIISNGIRSISDSDTFFPLNFTKQGVIDINGISYNVYISDGNFSNVQNILTIL